MYLSPIEHTHTRHINHQNIVLEETVKYKDLVGENLYINVKLF